jgi:hypothetical protein
VFSFLPSSPKLIRVANEVSHGVNPDALPFSLPLLGSTVWLRARTSFLKERCRRGKEKTVTHGISRFSFLMITKDDLVTLKDPIEVAGFVLTNRYRTR